MKNLWQSGIVILLIIGGLYIIFLRECKEKPVCPPEGKILINQSTWDSIIKISNTPPKVIIDTFWKKGEIIYVNVPVIPQPKPDPKDSTINNYEDSLINKEIDVKTFMKVRGFLLGLKWQYHPIIKIIRIDSTIYIPKIVIEEKVSYIERNDLILNASLGGNQNAFLLGGGVDFITKKGTEIGYFYQRYGALGFHNIKIGVRLFPRK
jgi:hypothetical protein